MLCEEVKTQLSSHELEVFLGHAGEEVRNGDMFGVVLSQIPRKTRC
jgi:acid phosphatase family membrane protein YuiD